MKKLLEKMLSRWLALDPESSVRMARLRGKVVRLELLGVGLQCQMIFEESGIALRWEDFLPEDLLIRGTPLRLLQLKFSADRQRFFADDVMVTGDMTLAHDVMAIFDECQPDWEEYFSHWVGDVPAHQIGRFLRSARRMACEVSQRFSENLSEYLHEEIALCPPREALQDFFNDVDALVMRVDRLEARVARLRDTR